MDLLGFHFSKLIVNINIITTIKQLQLQNKLIKFNVNTVLRVFHDNILYF